MVYPTAPLRNHESFDITNTQGAIGSPATTRTFATTLEKDKQRRGFRLASEACPFW
jgi:hypothetical protein